MVRDYKPEDEPMSDDEIAAAMADDELAAAYAEMDAQAADRGRGRMITELVNGRAIHRIQWQRGPAQVFTSLSDAMYALAHNGDACMSLAQAHALAAGGRYQPRRQRRNPITGHFTGGDRRQR